MVFINPPAFGKVGDYSSNPSYALGSTLDLSWANAASTADLYLMQDGDGYLCEPMNLANTYCHKFVSALSDVETSFQWVVQTFDSNYSTSNAIYYFALRDTEGSDSIDSHYFNIFPSSLLPAAATSTSSASSSTPTSTFTSKVRPSTATASPTSANDASATSSSASSSSSSSSGSSDPSAADISQSSGLSSTAKAAIGASIGIAVPLIIVLAIIAFYLRRRNKRNSPQDPAKTHVEYHQAASSPSKYSNGPQYIPEMQGNNTYSYGYEGHQEPAQELYGSYDRKSRPNHALAVELPASSNR